MFCANCGSEMDDNATVCPNCNFSVADVYDNEYDMYDEDDEDEVGMDGAYKKKVLKGVSVIIALCVLVSVVTLGCFVLYPQMMKNKKGEADQKEADKVINLIDSLIGEEVTVDMDDEVDFVRMSYNSLTEDQKERVTNYSEFEKISKKITKLKNEEIAKSMQEEIDLVVPEYLTAEDTSIRALRKKYESLTKEQQQLVQNANKITQYEQTVQLRIQEKEAARQREERINQTRELVYHFPGFYGRWGDFGAHVNTYQGMIESAIKNQISLTNYFYGSPNDVIIEVTSFYWDGTNISTAGCHVYFVGDAKSGGSGMYGRVISNADGVLSFSISEQF